jgi:hypothetical protein
MSESSYISAFLAVLHNSAPNEWNEARYDKRGCWTVEYKSVPPCVFHVEVGPTMVYLHSTVDVSVDPGCQLALYRYALRLNEEMSIARFGLDFSGKLSLMVECPRAGLTFASFESAARILVNYYKIHYPDIQLIAQEDVNLAKRITARELEKQAEEENMVTIEKPVQQEHN